MPVDEIVVLACSKKWGGRCVAGISRQTGRWLRPVSGSSHGELTPFYYRISGREIRPLDIVRFEHEGGLGDPSQPENVAVDGSRWRLTGRLNPDEAGRILSPYLVEGQVLLGNRGSAVPEEEAMLGVDASLALVRTRAVEFISSRRARKPAGRGHESALSWTVRITTWPSPTILWRRA